MLTNVPRSFQSTCIVESGLSDFHMMTLTVMRKSFKKFQPKIINYRSYKHFRNEAFRETLLKNLSQENFVNNDNGFQRFCSISLNSLEKHAPSKKKYTRGNHMPFFNKDLSKAIMTRTKLRNIFLQNKSEENKIRYTKQRNFCVSLLRKTKKQYYQNLNEKSVVDNKLFWKTVKPFLSEKMSGMDKIHLIENNELIKNDLKTAEFLNNFFSNIVQNLNIARYTSEESFVDNISDPTLKAILKYRNHPSIIAIRKKYKISECFKFTEVDQKDIEKEFLQIDVNKASQSSDIPTKIVIENVDIFADFINFAIAKLNAYGFHLSALKLIHDYLSNRKQRTKINSTYSKWHEILFGVPQGSILGPLLFNIYLIDLFFVIEDTDIASYADDNTPYIIDDTVEGVIKSLEEVSKKLFKWFDDNLMKSNADKCHLLVSTNETVKIQVGNYNIANSKCEKLLGINFDHNLNFVFR